MRVLGALLLASALVLCAANAGASQGRSDPPLVAKVGAGMRVVERAARVAGSGDPDAVQAHYDAARDLLEEVAAAVPASSACRDLRRHALALAGAHVLQAEGFDRLRPALAAEGRRRASAAKTRVENAVGGCRRSPVSPGGGTAGPPTVALLRPRGGEISFGALRIEAVAPSGAKFAVVSTGGGAPSCGATGARRVELSTSGALRVDLPLAPGRHDVAASFCSPASRAVGTAVAPGRWVLPATARATAGAQPTDRALNRRLARVADGFDGYSAVWYHDLASGRTAAWNAEARFPAASTVKLAVLVAALRALGRDAGEGRFGYDLATMTSWSSNLATNRVLRRVGRGSSEAGSRIANTVLRELGARSSTFTGEYRVGTSAGRPSAEPPLVSSRVTTARDLGRMLYVLHAGAIGQRAALDILDLDRGRAQAALGMLLDSEPLGDNVGLVRGSVPRSLPVAQKHGWISSARHTAAIVYPAAGPELVVLLTYRSRLNLAEAAAYAADVLRVTLRPATRRP